MNIIYDSLLLLPCFVSLFWAVTLLCNLQKNLRPQNIWIAYLLTMGICSMIWAILFSKIEDFSFYYKLDVIDLVCSASLYPLIYLYFWALTHAAPLRWKQYVWLFPGILLGIASTVLYAVMGDEQSTAYIFELVENADHYHFTTGSIQWYHCLLTVNVFSVLVFFQIIAGMIYATRNLIRYKQGLSHFFSNLEDKSIENNRAVLIGLFIMLGICFFAVCIWGISYEYYYHTRHFLMLGIGISIYCMSYHVSRITFDAENIITEMEADESTTTTSAELNETCRKVLPQLARLVDEDLIFLQPNLSLDDISRQINTNRTYISYIINTEFGCNFHEFINNKRIEYAQVLFIRNPHLTQEQIVEMSGFSHSSSFSRIFKKHTGITYREWQKTVK